MFDLTTISAATLMDLEYSTCMDASIRAETLPNSSPHAALRVPFPGGVQAPPGKGQFPALSASESTPSWLTLTSFRAFGRKRYGPSSSPGFRVSA